MHIVIFTGGDFPEPALTEAYFPQRKPDYVIAADSGILTFERYNGHFSGAFGKNGNPDAILGDMDSLAAKNAAAVLKNYPANIVQTFIADKDDTDTELALKKAHAVANAGDAWITLVGAGGGRRADHFLSVFDLFATSLRPAVWLYGEQALWYAPQGASFKVSGLGLRDMISVARTTASRTGGKVNSEGLLWEYDTFRAEGMPSISNRIKPEFYERGKSVTISVEAGEFVLIVPTSACVSALRKG